MSPRAHREGGLLRQSVDVSPMRGLGIKRLAYQLVLPAPVRRRIHTGNVRDYVTRWIADRSAYIDSKAAPDLSWAHIERLRVVPNREALIGCLPACGRIAHVGAGDGEMARRILEIARPTVIYLLDDPAEPATKAHTALLCSKFASAIHAGHVIVPDGTASGQLTSIERQSLNWILIDSRGRYAHWSTLLATCAEMLVAGGIIAGGHYQAPSCGDPTDSPVVQAVHEFCIVNAWEMILLTHESHRRLSFAIRRRAGCESRGD